MFARAENDPDVQEAEAAIPFRGRPALYQVVRD
jgi:hypothetical protein